MMKSNRPSRKSDEKSLRLAIVGVALFVIYLAVLNHALLFASLKSDLDIMSPNMFRDFRHLQQVDEQQQQYQLDGKRNTPKINSGPTLRGKKVLFEITTVGMRQFALLEIVLDSIRDLCESGASVSLHITTSTCDPKLELSRCTLTKEEEKLPKNYPPDILNQMNERLRCRDVDGSVETTVHIKSPEWGKQMVDFHRKIFYDNIDNGYDVFIHTEEDEVIRPTTILAFIDEMEKVRTYVGDKVSDTAIYRYVLNNVQMLFIILFTNLINKSVITTHNSETWRLFSWICSLRKSASSGR